MQTPFGKRLRQYREAKKLTLQQVGDAVGCTKAYIWELEMREGQRPTAERLNAIAKVLDVTVLHLLGEPIGGLEAPSPEDAAFFRDYAGMTDEEKSRYREALRLMFGSPKADSGS
jgi:transcriptional regulator with XRE-family HTH domain